MQTYDYAPPRIGVVKGESLPKKPKPTAKGQSIVERARMKKKGTRCK